MFALSQLEVNALVLILDCQVGITLLLFLPLILCIILLPLIGSVTLCGDGVLLFGFHFSEAGREHPPKSSEDDVPVVIFEINECVINILPIYCHRATFKK
jgi:hypothetical protein